MFMKNKPVGPRVNASAQAYKKVIDWEAVLGAVLLGVLGIAFIGWLFG